MGTKDTKDQTVFSFVSFVSLVVNHRWLNPFGEDFLDL
jgi:hypothetical protein